MSSSAARSALGLVCAAGFGLCAAVVLDRALRKPTGDRDERLLHRALHAVHGAVPDPRRFTVTAHAGRVLVSGPAAPGDEARIVGCLRAMGVRGMQLSLSEASIAAAR